METSAWRIHPDGLEEILIVVEGHALAAVVEQRAGLAAQHLLDGGQVAGGGGDGLGGGHGVQRSP